MRRPSCRGTFQHFWSIYFPASKERKMGLLCLKWQWLKVFITTSAENLGALGAMDFKEDKKRRGSCVFQSNFHCFLFSLLFSYRPAIKYREKEPFARVVGITGLTITWPLGVSGSSHWISIVVELNGLTWTFFGAVPGSVKQFRNKREHKTFIKWPRKVFQPQTPTPK